MSVIECAFEEEKLVKVFIKELGRHTDSRGPQGFAFSSESSKPNITAVFRKIWMLDEPSLL